MELKLQYENFRRCKSVHQHYYLECVWNKDTVFEFEGRRYQIIFQVLEETDLLKDGVMEFDLYPEALRLCGGDKVKSHFFEAIKEAAEAKAGQAFSVKAEVVGSGTARPENVEGPDGTVSLMYVLRGMCLTGSQQYLEIHMQMEEPIDVHYGNGVFQLKYEETLTFVVTEIK